jgi:hypothetical protein
MGCQRKIPYRLIIFLVVMFCWMPGNRPASGNEPSQGITGQNDIYQWLAELESRISDSGNNTEPNKTGSSLFGVGNYD